jgi:hypothetical protein
MEDNKKENDQERPGRAITKDRYENELKIKPSNLR